MKTYILSYVVTAVAFFALDFAWLSTMGARFYRAQLGDLMLEGFRPAPAIAFYLIYVVGIVVFVVGPARAQGTVIGAFGHGMLLGLCAYAAYDLTNLATLKNWPVLVSVVDLAWGTIATGITAAIAMLVLPLIDRG